MRSIGCWRSRRKLGTVTCHLSCLTCPATALPCGTVPSAHRGVCAPSPPAGCAAVRAALSAPRSAAPASAGTSASAPSAPSRTAPCYSSKKLFLTRNSFSSHPMRMCSIAACSRTIQASSITHCSARRCSFSWLCMFKYINLCI